MTPEQANIDPREALRTYYLTGEPIPSWPVAGSLPRLAPSHDSRFTDLASARLAVARRSAQARLIAEVTEARDRLLEVLQPEQPINEAFGAGAVQFLDTGRLAAIARRSGTQILAVARRRRLLDALGVLEQFLAAAHRWPAFWTLDLTAALDHATALLGELSQVLRAVRVSHLECEGGYDESRHPAQIARLRAAPEDLLSTPPVVAPTTAAEFDSLPIGVWNRLLQSAFPITLLLHAPDPTTFDLFLLRQVFGQALVGQTALANAAHLQDTVEQIGAASGPAVVVYSEQPWAPLFRHTPGGGLQVYQLSVEARPPDHAPLIPEIAWQDEQTGVPFLGITDGNGLRHRAALDQATEVHYRRLASWKEELSLRPPLPPSDDTLDAARREGARSAVQRLVEYLTGAAVGQTSTSARDMHIAPAKPEPTPTPEAQPVSSPEPESSDPYIDSFLCTSCNDCMKVNPRLFLYDANKQAYLGPISTGTFADLVKAAEGCPAKCIHPGTPRPGDASATAAVLARAAKLK